jgi:hypothetical protein
MYVENTSSLFIRDSGTTCNQTEEGVDQVGVHSDLRYVSAGAGESAQLFVDDVHVVSHTFSSVPQPLAYHIPLRVSRPAGDGLE